MDKQILANELKIGMFVKLPDLWLKGIGLPKEFVLTSQELITKVQTYASKYGKVYLTVQTSTPAPSTPDTPPPISKALLKTHLLTQKIQDAATSSLLPPKLRAKAVYDHSLDLMHNLFNSPTGEVIGATKEAVSKIVDLILLDEETAIQLLHVTNYDFYTYTHSVNVGILSISLAKN
ncbi:MAG: DUF3391 domain-containing protein [Magnetococcus sp. DMHC-6]